MAYDKEAYEKHKAVNSILHLLSKLKVISIKEAIKLSVLSFRKDKV